MNTLFTKSLLAAAVLFTFSSAQARSTYSERITAAVALLKGVAESVSTYKVTANSNPKVMMLEFGLNEQILEDAAEFETQYVSTADAWEVDSSLWGPETLKGGEAYVQENLHRTLEEGAQKDADKISYANGMLKSTQAFEALGYIKSVQFGVSPTGAVQGGVRFPALLIIDTEGGFIHEIIMEGSGC